MTVAELIAELQKMPLHAPVWVQTVPEWDSEDAPISTALVQEVRWEGNHVEIE